MRPVFSDDFSKESCADFREGTYSAWRDNSVLSSRVVPEAMIIYAPAAVAIAVGSHIPMSAGCKWLSKEGTCISLPGLPLKSTTDWVA